MTLLVTVSLPSLMLKLPIAKGTVHFLRGGGGGAGGIRGEGHRKKKWPGRGGPSKKNKGTGGSPKILPLLEGASWEKI